MTPPVHMRFDDWCLLICRYRFLSETLQEMRRQANPQSLSLNFAGAQIPPDAMDLPDQVSIQKNRFHSLIHFSPDE